MRYKANGYRHVGGDLPLNPPDSYWGEDEPEGPMTCADCSDECDESYDARCQEYSLPSPLCTSCWEEYLEISPRLRALTAEGQL